MDIVPAIDDWYQPGQAVDMVDFQAWGRAIEDALAEPAALVGSTTTSITGNTTVATDGSQTALVVSANQNTITFGAPATFPTVYSCWIFNTSTRRQTIVVSGATTFYVWPGQSARIIKLGSVWWRDFTPIWVTETAVVVYVNHASGSSSNDGLASGGALNTIQAAIDLIEKYVDVFQLGITIQVADGTFTEASVVVTKRLRGYHVLYIKGNTGSPSSCVWQVGAGQTNFTARDWSGAILDGFKLVATGAGSVGFSSSQNGIIDVWRIEFGAYSGGYHLNSTNGGSLGFVTGAACTISGDMYAHIRVDSGGCFTCIAATYSIPNARTFTAFLDQQGGSTVFSGTTFSGAGSGGGSVGTKYSVSFNGTCLLGGVTLPGATAGSTSTGGQAA